MRDEGVGHCRRQGTALRDLHARAAELVKSLVDLRFQHCEVTTVDAKRARRGQVSLAERIDSWLHLSARGGLTRYVKQIVGDADHGRGDDDLLRRTIAGDDARNFSDGRCVSERGTAEFVNGKCWVRRSHGWIRQNLLLHVRAASGGLILSACIQALGAHDRVTPPSPDPCQRLERHSRVRS